MEFLAQFSTDIRHVSGDCNGVTDAISHVDEIHLPVQIDFYTMAKDLKFDNSLESLMRTGSGLKIKPIKLSSGAKLRCDVSTDTIRPYIPETSRKIVFDSIHYLSHFGGKATVKLIKDRFIWPTLQKSCTQFSKNCISCQSNKKARHSMCPVGKFPLISVRFKNIHLDIIGPLPPSGSHHYFFTCVVRYSRWPEVLPMPDTKSETCFEIFLNGWISRFGVHEVVPEDLGSQYESKLFLAFTRRLGSQRIRATRYFKASNDMVERCNRQLKDAVRCHGLSTPRWTIVLPLVMVDIRANLKEDLGVSSAELPYGKPLRLPGEFFQASKSILAIPRFLHHLKIHIQSLKSVSPSNHAKNKVIIHKDLPTITHVFVRREKPFVNSFSNPMMGHTEIYLGQIRYSLWMCMVKSRRHQWVD
ncbi:hypothetical protein AVEN_149611-1 [Araneus ventricosus]|uniref:RNA-directed DNA polymerase n=1 Tax=Araneus ventricosus TaxID=182803 RepID=A0A4Y2KXY0_ARAVE|nr:hypothetical protein AVEN_149611-1 [Araneus ventricosus]